MGNNVLQFDPGILEKPAMIEQGDCDADLGTGGKVENIIAAVCKIGDAVYTGD